MFLLAKDVRNITTLLRAMKGKNARLNIAVMGSNLLLKLISQLRWWRRKNLWWWRWEFLSNTLISHFTSYFILWQWRGRGGWWRRHSINITHLHWGRWFGLQLVLNSYTTFRYSKSSLNFISLKVIHWCSMVKSLIQFFMCLFSTSIFSWCLLAAFSHLLCVFYHCFCCFWRLQVWF